jgi:hypothetical protein
MFGHVGLLGPGGRSRGGDSFGHGGRGGRGSRRGV